MALNKKHIQHTLKVLVLSHSSELSGGAERSMLDLFDEWTSKGLVEPHFILRKPLVGLEKEISKRGWHYTSIHYTNWAQRNPTKRKDSIFLNTKVNSRAIFDIEKIIDKISPDVVMTNTIISPWAALAAYYKKIPHIWFVRELGTDHGHVFEIGRKETFSDIGTLSKMVITNSKMVEKDISQFIDADKITTLYNPFKTDKIKELSAKSVKSPFIYKDSLKLVIIGRISDSKGQDKAADAVGRLINMGYDVELCIIGSPSLKDDDASLKRIIARYNIHDRVHIIGHKNNPLPYISISDIGVMASKAEAFGRVTFEYMILGKPVIGSRSGATPELIKHNYSGRLFELGDSKSLAKNIEPYLKDKKLISRHGKNAKLKAENMMVGENSANKVFKKIKKILNIQNEASSDVINLTHRWLEYPLLAQDFMDEYNQLSLKKVLYRKARARVKYIYVGLNGRLGKWKK